MSKYETLATELAGSHPVTGAYSADNATAAELIGSVAAMFSAFNWSAAIVRLSTFRLRTVKQRSPDWWRAVF